VPQKKSEESGQQEGVKERSQGKESRRGVKEGSQGEGVKGTAEGVKADGLTAGVAAEQARVETEELVRGASCDQLPLRQSL
jgi:hypothetical protein